MSPTTLVPVPGRASMVANGKFRRLDVPNLVEHTDVLPEWNFCLGIT